MYLSALSLRFNYVSKPYHVNHIFSQPFNEKQPSKSRILTNIVFVFSFVELTVYSKDVIFVFISSALVPPSKHGVRRPIAAQIG